MYIETHLIPNNRDEWIINLHLSTDNTKVEARVVKGYNIALEETRKWAEELGRIPYSVGNMQYNKNDESEQV